MFDSSPIGRRESIVRSLRRGTLCSGTVCSSYRYTYGTRTVHVRVQCTVPVEEGAVLAPNFFHDGIQNKESPLNKRL
jgi:hypothetical protein